ncbi:ATP-binding protein [Alistipes sp.]|uniref:sensor histidine kinase n=1 Tax=Alistipes sp. TaxID=1872444 RepID=UPI003AEF7BAD
MRAANDPNCVNPDPSDRKGACRCPGAGYYSDLMLEAMQTGAIFFDCDGIIYRTNTLARQDLRVADDPAGVGIADLLSVFCNGDDLLPGLLRALEEPENAQVKLPAGTIMRCLASNAQFFVSGCITRLECGRRLLSFRNIMDEITRERILSMVLARTKIFPWFYDLDQDRMLIDAHWFSYLGIPAGDGTITQEQFFARVHPDEREMLAEALRVQLTSQEVQDTFSYRLLRGDGTWEWFSEQSMYLGRTEDGSPYRVVGVCQSIQEHKTTEETLRLARDKAQESERLKSAFLANMSHEIRTPLNAIVGFSNLLIGGEVDPRDEEVREYSALISRNCDYLITLVTDILDLSRMESGSMNYCVGSHSMNRLLRDIYDKFAERMPEGVQIRLRLPKGDLRAETDDIRLRQVMENLVGNAVKFTRKGHIELGCSRDARSGAVRLFVADTGLGIPRDERERIFDRFYKIDAFKQGAGLGLSVCKTIVEGMGGRIDVASRPGRGSRFTVTLPASASEA